MSERKVEWERMFPDEFQTALDECPVCYLTYGLAEPHGRYNALGLDGLKAYALARRAARDIGGIVAPAFLWHVTELECFPWLESNGVDHHMNMTTSLPLEHFLKTVVFQLAAAERRGFRASIIITGHYGGIEKVLRLLGDWYMGFSDLAIRAFADWELITVIPGAPGGARGDHAGPIETSQLMALEPELVDPERVTPPLAKDDPKRFCGGLNKDNVHEASRDWGERIVASQVDSLRRVARELLGGQRGQVRREHKRAHREMYERWPSFVEAYNDFEGRHPPGIRLDQAV
jgi:creatinine amidohydrolase